ncbi:MAG: SDR family NAD(P)-dependent oxidoreductase [Bifidobacteriaceae bacterium]|jgi:NAD(P)-dependent dehydrogenase (short-subunit alcohol dehydrogenase family)|nr:SDR family NAD(P)-dependent oxidoreductase [Bifidobacteriaceae bacterium]
MSATEKTIILVTGSSDGIGAQTARNLAVQGHAVVAHARSVARAEAARAVLPPGMPIVIGDLSLQSEVRSLAEQASRLGRIGVIVHAAGTAAGPARTVTRDGVETTFAVNTLAPHLLTKLLSPSAPSRVVFVASDSFRHSRLDLTDIELLHGWSPALAYANSKLAVSALAMAWARHLPNALVNALHPGWVRTKMSPAEAPLSVAEGADTPTWLAASNDPAALVTGEFFTNRKPDHFNPQVFDQAAQDAVFTACEALIRA